MCEEYTFSRGSPPGRIFHHETTVHRACLVRRRAAGPARAAAALHRRRGDDPFDARRDGAGPHHVARDRPAVPHAHRDVRGQAARGDHRQPRRAGGSRRARSRARAGQGPRSAPRHSGCAQGQHPYDQHADDRRRSGVRRVGAAVRGDADEEPARRRRHHHRQDRHDRARQLGGGRAVADARQLQRRRRLRLQPVRSAPRSARGHQRRPAGARHRRLELGRRDGREPLGGERRHRDVWLGAQPIESKHAGWREADRRTHQPVRHHPHHRGSGYGGPHGEDGDRCRNHARRTRERIARFKRSGDDEVHASGGPRLHAVPQCERVARSAHRHPARVLLRQDDAARRQGAAWRAERRSNQGDQRRDRRAQTARRGHRRSRRHPERRRQGCEKQPAAVEHLLGRNGCEREGRRLFRGLQVRHEARLQQMARDARVIGAGQVVVRAAPMEHHAHESRRHQVRAVEPRRVGRDGS